MFKVIKVKKRVGETNLELLNRVKKSFFYRLFLSPKKLSFLSRLDPLASGLCFLAVGPDPKIRAEFLNKNKVYKFSLIWGIKTDTADILGLISQNRQPHSNSVINSNFNLAKFESQIQKELKAQIGKNKIKIPLFSSPNLNKDGQIKNANFNQEKEIQIYNFKLKKSYLLSASELNLKIQSRILKVKNQNFRNQIILKSWQDFFNHLPASQSFIISEFEIKTSSGFYVRSIADKFSIPATAFDIQRLKFF